MRGQVLVHLGDEVAVVCAVFVEPENRLGAGGAGASDGKLHPIANGHVFRLAHAPNVAGFYGVTEQGVALGIHHAHGAGARDLKSLVVRAVFLAFWP